MKEKLKQDTGIMLQGIEPEGPAAVGGLILGWAEDLGTHRQDARRIYLRETRRVQSDRGGLPSDPARPSDAIALVDEGLGQF